MRTLLALFLTLALVSWACADECPPCSRVRCAPLTAECADALSVAVKTNQSKVGRTRVLLHSGYCGCCPVCFHLLEEDETCPTEELVGEMPHALCDEGLRCNIPTGKCVKA